MENLLKKKKICDENIFSDKCWMKFWKVIQMVGAVKTDIKQQEIKKLVAVSYNFWQAYLLLKLETT